MLPKRFYCPEENSYKVSRSYHLWFRRYIGAVNLPPPLLHETQYALLRIKLRSGGATTAANNGVTDRLFKRYGR